ncbi:MAG: HAMP domain-containing sensor histidine kinase [Candidatus Campbellbacteria bacterium]|nr:HAMP domain-containing sensor histidine kinase [Candidatus Campbellbacteria bacterium]
MQEIESRERIEKLAEELRGANAKLHRVNMLKTEFVSVATHQLRSPLTAIKGYTSMILEDTYGKVPKKLKEPLERVFRSTESLTQVVQDFLDVSRIEQGSMNYNFAAFDFKDLVTEVVEDQKPNIEKSGLEVTFEKEEHPEEKNYILRGDRLKFKQVITNLIDNAIKYTKEGFIRISLRNKDGKIRLEVADSGMGINEKTLKTLFKKFHRADNADEVNVQGTGLGLYIAKQIVETHNGKIWAESDGLGEGSTFIIELDNN